MNSRRKDLKTYSKMRDMSHEKDKKLYKDLSIKQDEILKEIKELE